MADSRYTNGIYTHTAANNRQAKQQRNTRIAAQLPELNGWQKVYWSNKLGQQVYTLKSGGAYMVYVNDTSPLLELTGNDTGWLVWDSLRSLNEVMAGSKAGMKFMVLRNKPMADITAEAEALAHPPVTVKGKIEQFFNQDPRNVDGGERQHIVSKKSSGLIYLQLRANGSWLLCLAQDGDVKIAKQIGHQVKTSVISSKSQTCWQRKLDKNFCEVYQAFVEEIKNGI